MVPGRLPAVAGGTATPAYTPRRADETVLYRRVAEHLETFPARARDRGRPPPRFVERELRLFRECGIFADRFLRVYCDSRKSGLILHTRVGIGYEVPWRQVEAMLLMAAGRAGAHAAGL